MRNCFIPNKQFLTIPNKPYPGHDHKQAGGKVVGHHVEGHLPREDQLESRHTVVHAWNGGVSSIIIDLLVSTNGHVVGVRGVQGSEGDLVVEDRLDALLIGSELKRMVTRRTRRWSLHLREKSYLAHRIVEASDFELTNLE